MWSDRDMEEEQYVPDHLLNHLTLKRTENNGGLDAGGGGGNHHHSGGGHHLHHQLHHQHHVVAAGGEYLDSRGAVRGNGVDMMEPMLAHMGDQVNKLFF
jgi:hypothetical protein